MVTLPPDDEPPDWSRKIRSLLPRADRRPRHILVVKYFYGFCLTTLLRTRSSRQFPQRNRLILLRPIILDYVLRT